MSVTQQQFTGMDVMDTTHHLATPTETASKQKIQYLSLGFNSYFHPLPARGAAAPQLCSLQYETISGRDRNEHSIALAIAARCKVHIIYYPQILVLLQYQSHYHYYASVSALQSLLDTHSLKDFLTVAL